MPIARPWRPITSGQTKSKPHIAPASSNGSSRRAASCRNETSGPHSTKRVWRARSHGRRSENAWSKWLFQVRAGPATAKSSACWWPISAGRKPCGTWMSSSQTTMKSKRSRSPGRSSWLISVNFGCGAFATAR
jgi:hypothetical protein